MHLAKFGRVFTVLVPVLASGCTLWPPELPSAISSKVPAAASDSSATDTPAAGTKSTQREEFLYIE